MNFYIKYSACALCFSTLVGCSTIADPINHLRQHRQDKSAVEYRKNTAKNRSVAIQDSETAFSPAIACLSDHWLRWQEEAEQPGIKLTQEKILELIGEAKIKGLNVALLSPDGFDPELVNNAIAKELAGLKKENMKLELSQRLINDKINNGGSVTKKIKKNGDVDITEHRGISPQEQRRYLEIAESLEKNAERTQALENLNVNINAFVTPLADLDPNRLFDLSVSQIFDKTGKIYDKDSTALSELVAHALTYNSALHVVDTPYNSDSAVISRANLKATNSTMIGQVFPTKMFISGGLVQYDEGDAKPYLDYLRLNLDTVDLSKEIKSITVGLTLRLVQSDDGKVYFSQFYTGSPAKISRIEKEMQKFMDKRVKNVELTDDETSELNAMNEELKMLQNDKSLKKQLLSTKPLSVFMENTFFTQDMGGGILRIIGTKNWSVDTHVTVSDPKMYAVREMIERAVYELLKRAIPDYELSDDVIKYTGFQSDAAACDGKLPVIPDRTVSK